MVLDMVKLVVDLNWTTVNARRRVSLKPADNDPCKFCCGFLERKKIILWSGYR